ncbi:MAG: hypothetical protein D6703_05230 [Zetaproteobacteria bacterium]|nr:MAG: hypothetical protein D6703_05230 [Zetaproteobacteria bacterium]
MYAHGATLDYTLAMCLLSCRFLCALLLMCGTLSPAWAIDQELHQSITHVAIADYRHCMGDILGHTDLPDPEMLRIVEQGTAAEDNVTLARLFNWHFYDFFRHDPVYAMKPGHSLHRIFHRRIDELREALRKGRERAFWEAGGRVLHYLQDMVVPAHIAPNYHVKPKTWWQRIFVSNQPDAFDSLLDPRRLFFRLDDQTCRILWQDQQAIFSRPHFTSNHEWEIFNQMLDEQAADTRQAIQKIRLPNGDSLAQAFWHLRDPEQQGRGTKQGFAPYGRHVFSPGTPPCGKGKTDVCIAFLQRQYRQAMVLTVRTLMVLERLAKHAFTHDGSPLRQKPSGFSSAQW